MGRKKRTTSTTPGVINDSKQQNNKQKPNDISQAANQPQQKIANQNVTPATNQLHEPEGTTPQECSPEQQKSQINLNDNNTSEDSDDSHRLQIDESDPNVTKDSFQDDESITNSENMQTDSVVEEYPPHTFHHALPTLEHALTLSKWRDGKDPEDKDGRYKKMVRMPKLYLILQLTPNCTHWKKSTNINLEKILNPFMEAM